MKPVYPTTHHTKHVFKQPSSGPVTNYSPFLAHDPKHHEEIPESSRFHTETIPQRDGNRDRCGEKITTQVIPHPYQGEGQSSEQHILLLYPRHLNYTQNERHALLGWLSSYRHSLSGLCSWHCASPLKNSHRDIVSPCPFLLKPTLFPLLFLHFP